MYRTPGRRALSPDSPVLYRDSPRSPEERSWSRGHSPPRKQRSPSRRSRSPDRRGRSPDGRGRSPDGRGRSPDRRGRSPDGRGRSPNRRGRSPDGRGRSPDGRGRSRSRPRGHSRSKSRSRAGRSRSRPRRSPPTPHWVRSPDDEYRRERRRSPGRHSPSFRSSPAREPRTSGHRTRASPPQQDRSGDVKLMGNDSSLRSCSGDLHASPLPMPKKSILKKRPDVEPSSSDKSPQANMLLSSKDGRSVSSVGAGKSTESPLSMVVKMDPLTPSTSNSSALAAAAQRPEAPLPQGSHLLTVAPANQTLSRSADFVVQRNVTCKTPPHSSTTGNLSPKTSPKFQTAPFSGGNDFPKKEADVAGSFLLPHDQDYKQSSLLSKASDIRQCRSTKIDDEELFLYGDEEKMAAQTKAQSDQTVSTPPVKSSENKQEFEKIQDLLKTIGLDIGVTEIGKLAVRTQERLHGKKVAPKITQPTAEQSQSGAMVNSAELKANVSEPKEPEPQVKAERKEEPTMKTEAVVKPPPVSLQSSAPIPIKKPQLILRKPLPKETIAAPKVEVPVQLPIPCSVSEPTLSPISSPQIPIYPPYPHCPMVPGYSMPPSYNPYTPYVSYPTSSWTMYSPVPPQPPPAHIPPLLPPVRVPVSAPTPVYNPRSNLRVIETTEDLSDAKAAVKTDAKPTTSLATLLAERETDRKNKEAEKIKKVLEELGSVRKEHKAKSKSLKTISTKVEQLRIQQGILLRKKQREKDGHKDPLLEELNNVLETAQKQINSLSEETNTAKQKQLQLTKVAEILGVSPTDLAEKSALKKEKGSPVSLALTKDSDNESRTSSVSSKSANDLKSRSSPVSDANAKSSSSCGADTKILGATQLSNVTVKSEVQCKGRPPIQTLEHFPEPHSPRISKSRDKSQSKSPRPTTPSSNTPANAESPLPFEMSKIFKYYDPGSHWCEDCNEICMTLLEFLPHFHDEKHKQSLKEVRQPWVKKKPQEPSSTKKRRLNVPLKGAEFLLPVNGHYCELCEETFPDHTAADDHLRTYAHNNKYKKYVDVHINYEVVRQEKKASLTAAQEMDQRMAEHKRKIAEQKFEVQACSKSKKPKKEEEENKVKSKHRSTASPPSSDQRRNKTPEKDPAKNTTFGKFVLKTSENNTQAVVNSAKVEAAPIKPKEEEPKTHGLKQNAFVIKRLSKPSTLPGNASTPSHSTASTTITSTTSTTLTSASPPSTSTTQPKVRPNLPSLLSIRLPTPYVRMSKPAPLMTFLSIKSSNATSKSIPIVSNKLTGVFPENLVSKAFRGEMAIFKESAPPESKDKTPNMEPKKTDGQSMNPVEVTKRQGLFNVLVNKNETVERQEIKNEKESSVPKLPSSWISEKSDPVPATTSHANIFGPIKPAASTGPAKVQHTPNTKSTVTNPALSPISSTFANSSLNNSTTGLSNNARLDNIINPTNPQAEKAGPTLLIPLSGNVTSSLGTKHSPANPSALQQELDSYYKMIASEDDPEDLTTSEDQDLEDAPQPTNVIRTFLQTKLESPPEKNVKLERVHGLVKPPIRPVLSEVSGEDFEDSDMACEVPGAVLSSVSQTSGWNLMHSNYASSNSQQPFSLASGKVSMNKDPHVTTVAASEDSMEDMSVYVTCDSD